MTFIYEQSYVIKTEWEAIEYVCKRSQESGNMCNIGNLLGVKYDLDIEVLRTPSLT